ncbi:hypothetical protein LWI28_029259 [Acer negundo]|uniref:Uncharacterized protein n=1 Tax=Acer negundo TaxID=4023 RepID=A0AAD5IXR7_ACENE|nr:hypothetical protein LWI28_029259 [Acer negundo]
MCNQNEVGLEGPKSGVVGGIIGPSHIIKSDHMSGSVCYGFLRADIEDGGIGFDAHKGRESEDVEGQLLISFGGDLVDMENIKISGNSSMKFDCLFGLVPISGEGIGQHKRRGGVDLAHKAGSVDRGLVVVSPGISTRRRMRKNMVPLKGHNMTRRSFSACEKEKRRFFESNSKMVWNLEEKVVKVFEKGIAMGLISMDEGTFQFHEKCGNSRKDQFIPSCLLERLEGRNAVQSSLNNQLSFEKVTGASMINQLCLASERGFGMGSSGLGPLDKPHVACPKPKRVHFKDGRLPAKIVGLNRPVSPILNGNLELVRNKAFCDDRVGVNDESDDSSKEQSLADPPLQVPKFGADVGLEQAMSRNISSNIVSSEFSFSSSDYSMSHVFETHLLDSDRMGTSAHLVRGEPSQKRWNLEDEVAKVVEKGVALGYFNGPKASGGLDSIPSGSLGQKNGSWCLSLKVAKVTETGITLGFDFHGKVDLLSMEISMR